MMPLTKAHAFEENVRSYIKMGVVEVRNMGLQGVKKNNGLI